MSFPGSAKVVISRFQSDRVVYCYKGVRVVLSLQLLSAEAHRLPVVSSPSPPSALSLQLQLLDALLVYLHGVKRKLIRQTYTKSSAPTSQSAKR
jgi:hypothetical protein